MSWRSFNVIIMFLAMISSVPASLEPRLETQSRRPELNMAGICQHAPGCTTRLHSLPYWNSLWHSNAIWQHRSGSILAQVMACCLTAPSNYLNRYWLIIGEVLWYSPESNFTPRLRCSNDEKVGEICEIYISRGFFFNVIKHGADILQAIFPNAFPWNLLYFD